MAYCIFKKSLRSLELCVKIPPKSPCTNFQNPCKFKNLIFILKEISFSFWPSMPNRLTGLLGLLAHSAHPASSSSFSTEAGKCRRRRPFIASPRRTGLARHGATALRAAPHPTPIFPSPSFNPQSKMPVKSKPFHPN
jgi:hypothetical protein